MLLFHQNLQPTGGGGSPLSRTLGTRVSSNGATVTSGSMVIPDNSLVVLITKTMRDTSDVSPLTITNSGAAATWTQQVVTPSQTDQYSQRIWFHTAYFTTGGTFTFTATAASAPPGGFSALTLLPIVYQNASTTLGVSGSANNGPTDGAWTPSLSGAPAASSDVLAAFTATVSGSGDLYQTDGSGVTRLDTANAAGVYGGSVSVRTGSTAASYTWDDVLAPSSTDSIYLNSVYAALEIKQAAGGGGSTQTLTPGLFTNTQSFYSPTVALAGGGSQSLTAARFDNANTFFAPAVTTGPVALAPGLFINAQSFFAPTVAPGAVALAPSLATNTQSFFAATVSTGPVALAPGLFTNAQTFYPATVSLGGGGSQSLTATRFDNSNTFFAHTVSPGAVTLLPNLLANSQSFYASAVSVGVVVLSPELLANANTFFSATVSLGGGAPQNLGPSLFSNSNAFFGPSVSVGPVSLLPGRLDNSNAFFGPAVLPGAVTLSPGLLAGTNSFFAPTVQSVASLAPGLLVNANAFYGPTVTRGAVTIAPALLVNTNAFFNVLVDGAQYTLTAAQAQKLHQIYLLHGLKLGSPLTVGPNARSAGGVEQTLTGSDPVTVHTTDAPIAGGLDVGLMIEELAALHGLGVDLTVTPTSRTAGSIEQSLQLQGASTVVTRL